MSRLLRHLALVIAYWTYLGTCAAQSHLPESAHITTGRVGVDYCDNGAGLAVATIHIKLTITNRGDKDLILSRRLGPDENVKVMNPAGAVVYSPHPTFYYTKNDLFGAAPDDSMFEIIKPGKSSEREFIVGLPVSKDPAHLIKPAPPSGEYRVSALRSTWPFYGDEGRARVMRQKWSAFGSLVIGPIKITDVPVRINLPAQMEACTADSTQRVN